MHEADPRQPSDRAAERPSELRCDFCGEVATRVRRVALDRGYDRLQVRHQVQYACSRCSEEKERRRLSASPAVDPPARVA